MKIWYWIVGIFVILILAGTILTVVLLQEKEEAVVDVNDTNTTTKVIKTTDDEEEEDITTGTETDGLETELLTVDEQGVSTFDETALSDTLEEASTDASTGELSQEEIEGMIFMHEEEKLARDVYMTLYDIWSINTFTNIADAEQTHMDAVDSLLTQYGVESTINDTVGLFNNSDLQTLYDDLVARGETSEEEAVRVGAAIEEIDILDLEEYVAETDNETIIAVYENLIKGSRNHLRAFVNQLERLDVEYTPEYLTASVYAEIVGADVERGRN